MKKITIYKLTDVGEKEECLTCVLEDDKIKFTGNEKLINSFKKDGIVNYKHGSSENVTPDQAGDFFENLPLNFKSGYFSTEES